MQHRHHARSLLDALFAVVSLWLSMTSVQAFVVPSISSKVGWAIPRTATTKSHHTTTTQLFYQKNATITDGSSNSNTGATGSSSSSTTATSLFQTSIHHEIPVIGPLLTNTAARPLIMGASLWLSPPTPLQWKTIEVCVEACLQQQQQQAGNGTHVEGVEVAFATVHAAPLVAVLNEHSEFATIAAIVGIQKTTAAGDDDELSSMIMDKFDPTSFRHSLAGVASPYYNEGSRVRLLGIGRAKLSRFTTRDEHDQDDSSSTMANQENDPKQGKPSSSGEAATVVVCKEDEDDQEDCNTIEKEQGDDCIVREPVLMARMQLVLDGPLNKEKEFGAQSSPVHALSQLSRYASRLNILHKDRQRMVQGLQAAQTKLDMASQQWQDWDGIGELMLANDNDENTDAETSSHTATESLQSKVEDFMELVRWLDHARSLSPEAARLVDADQNYGLGSTPSAYSDYPALTNVLVEALQPYYSPERVQTETFHYAVYSWVVLQSMMAVLQPEQGSIISIQAIMESTNTVERMELLYHAMIQHKEALNELALAKSQELRDCGEECDLF
jgi:hypothetical protein